ncbi:hypothetical protein HDV00_009497 [Rhizophlyctis rosea]|nr:hypothetical protein HDV00_009497 [Rhizophlyctis rosea]
METVVDAPAWEQPQAGPWIKQLGEGGTIFWFNSETGETTLEEPQGLDGYRPDGDSDARDSGYSTSSQDLPEGWIVFEAEDGSMVYYNAVTKETRWTPPDGPGVNGASYGVNASPMPVTPASPGGFYSAGPLSAPLSANANGPMQPMGYAPMSGRPRTGSGGASRPPPLTDGLPPNWGKKILPDSRVYYYNMLTDETTWNLEDINMETGELINRGNSIKRNSQGSNRSATSLDSRNSPSGTATPALDFDPTHWSWSRLTSDIITAIQALNHSAKNNIKERYIPQSSTIVESIRIMLYASGTARKDAPLVASHKMIKMHHRHIMSSLSKLVLAAKQASGVWPPPDAVVKMQQSANEVLVAVRHFVAAAQEANVEISSQEGVGAAVAGVRGRSASGSVVSGVAAGGEGVNGGAASVRSLNVGGGAGGAASMRSLEMEEPKSATPSEPFYSTDTLSSQNSSQPTNSELIAQLERYTRSVVQMITGMVHSIRANECNSSMLITQVRGMVTEVGNFLSLVDELPLDSLSDNLTVDFKVNRLALYNSISGLVMSTQTATNPLAPSNAIEEVIMTTGLVEKAVKDLLISTKFLVEEKESLEQLTLQNYIEQNQRRRSEVPKRGMSLGVAGARQQAAKASVVGGGGDGGDVSPGEQAPGQPPESEKTESSGASLAVPTTPSAEEKAAFIEEQAPTSGEAPVPATPSDTAPQSASTAPLTDQPPATPSTPMPAALERTKSCASASGQKLNQMMVSEPVSATQPERRSENGKPWYLCYDYSPEEIVYTMENKVKGGSLSALIVRLTIHDSLDPNFTQTFLLTYRSFTNTLEFFDLLIKRFMIQPPEGLTTQELEIFVEKKLTPIRLRVFNVMKSWLDLYVQDDETDRSALIVLREFAQGPMNEAMGFAAQQLIRLVDKRESSLSAGIPSTPGGLSSSASISGRKLLPAVKDCPPPITPRNMHRIRFFEIDPLEVARQLTIMESREYIKVVPVEFLKKAWSDKESNLAVNVKSMISISNQVTGWVASAILSEKDVKKRAQLIKQFILIADRCRSLNNFNTLMSILAGLNSAPIHRLKRTWDYLSQRTQQTLEALRNTMSPTRNFAIYREALHSVNPPCVPFLGFYLTDLTFIEDGNPDNLKGPAQLINFSKRMKTAEVIREIQQYQNVPYALMPVPELQQYLRANFAATMDDQSLYNKSLALEPKEREDEKITRILHESGFL